MLRIKGNHYLEGKIKYLGHDLHLVKHICKFDNSVIFKSKDNV